MIKLKRRNGHTSEAKIKLKRKKEEPLSADTSHWDLITSFGRKTCCICDKTLSLKRKAVYVGKHPKNGEELWRHDKCDCLSLKWSRKFRNLISINSTGKERR